MDPKWVQHDEYTLRARLDDLNDRLADWQMLEEQWGSIEFLEEDINTLKFLLGEEN